MVLAFNQTKMKKTNKKGTYLSIDKVLFIFLAIIMVFFCGLRSNMVGRDGLQYYNFYSQANSESFYQLTHSWQQNNVEIGYVAFEFFFAHVLHVHYNFFLIILAIGSVLPPLYVIYRFSPNKYFALLLYILFGHYTFVMSANRQCLAIGMMCLAFVFLVDKRYYLFLLFAIIGGLFHYSGFLILPLVLIHKVKYSQVLLLVWGILILLGFVAGNYFYSFLSQFARISYNASANTGGFGLYFFYLFLSLVAIVFTRKQLKNNPLYFKLFVSLLLVTAIWPYLRFNVNAFRALFFYNFIALVCFTNTIKHTKDDKLKIILGLICLIAGAIYFVRFNELSYTGYSFFWME